MITCWRIASSSSDGTSATAALRNWSPGMNSTTKSGLCSNCDQYAFCASCRTRSCTASGVAPQRDGAVLVGRRLGRGQVGIERRLDVDDDLPAVRHVDDHVGAQRAVLALHVHLLDEIAALDHAREFGEPPQRHLAPLAAHFGSAQRGDEVARLALQRDLAERDALERARSAPKLSARSFSMRAICSCVLLQRLAHRGQHRLDRFLALGQVAQRHFLLLPERLPGELQERLVVAAQRLAGDAVEAGAQPLQRQVE